MKLLLLTVSLAVLGSAQAWTEFTLYTQANPRTAQILTVNDANSVATSNFDSSRPTKIVTHGWRGNDNTLSVTDPRDAYLATEDVNVIVFNWIGEQSILSSPHNNAIKGAAALTDMINFLVESANLNKASTTLVGHSLGAHAIAIAARATGGIESIVALDPAGTDDWETNADGIALGVQPGDASHVQVIHTNGGGMGLDRATGDSDFYINGGKSQPGCLIDLMGICAHMRSSSYFAESIMNPVGFPSNEDPTVFLGGSTLSKHALGSYTLETNSRPPFARG